MAADIEHRSKPSRCRRQAQLGYPFCRWQCHSYPPKCRRGKKGELDPDKTLSALEQVQIRERLERSQGGFSTKIHLRCDGNGLPMTFLLTVGERHETVVFEQLMEQGAVKRSGAGRPRLRPKRVSGDKGYSSGKIRRYLRGEGCGSPFRAKTTNGTEVSLISLSTVSATGLSGVLIA